ncbi:MAG: DNA mismatch repair protein MutS [Phycisphaeraceae bacterium]|nr:DNA mismatch repair protein MutS [Phycisphaeraceae bacterium]
MAKGGTNGSGGGSKAGGGNDPRQTPAMRQYFAFKAKHPDCALLFRMGDFYETFDDDAVKLSKALGLTLTQRTAGLPMAGVPYHQLEVYLRRAISAGFRVAVADQIEDPSEAKGIVARAVTRVLTPGTLVDDSVLPDDATNRLGAACFSGWGDGNDEGEESEVGLAVVEVSTGAFTVVACAASSLLDELSRRGVTELLYADPGDGRPPARVKRVIEALSISGTPRPSWQFRTDEALEALREQYKVRTLGGFGLDDRSVCVPAAGAVIRYLKETQTPAAGESVPKDSAYAAFTRATLAHISPPRVEFARGDGGLGIDATSLRALEIERPLRQLSFAGAGNLSGTGDGSLLGLFLGTSGAFATPMGRRLLREWLVRPLGSVDRIRERQTCVACLVEDRRFASGLFGAIDGVQDAARIAARVALARVTPRDIVALGSSLARVDAILAALGFTSGAAEKGVVGNPGAFMPHASRLNSIRDALQPLATRITTTCVDAPPAHLREGGLIRDGIDAELDEARLLQRDAGQWMLEYQQRLMSEHQIAGLKVGYNKIFGYYIELTAAQARSAPATFTRKQTLKNAERYITPELKAFEDKVSTAEARAVGREQAIFDALCAEAMARLTEIRDFAEIVAELDALHALAHRASLKGWIKPEIVEEPTLVIHGGRHPVLEDRLGRDFVPNDLELGAIVPDDAARAPLALITGPNMAGKSTFIRQTALITLLAHAGSFVPADRATIGIVDRIFTRVGADDAIHQGQSTFMVEMTETANILNNATPRSLVVLDEIGRGTSTLDGLSLAWAITEHLAGECAEAGTSEDAATAPTSRGPRTLFATHYHELTHMEERLPGRVRNLHVAVREWTTPDGSHEIVFLHRILPGRTDQSYGIHVARLAGIPRDVTDRAKEVLDSLAVQHDMGGGPEGIFNAASSTGVGADEAPAKGNPPKAPRTKKPDISRITTRAPRSQLALFTEILEHPAVSEIREMKLDAMTPMQAFDMLREIKRRVDEK